MGIDLEDELRAAFRDLPGETPGVAQMANGAISRAGRLRRRRSLLVGGGATAAVAAVVAAAVVGASLHQGGEAGQLQPAGTASISKSSASADPSRKTSSSSTSTSHSGASIKAGTPLAMSLHGVSAALLPHDQQLPASLRYDTASPQEPRTSAQLPDTEMVFLAAGLGSDLPGVDHAGPDNFGQLATVWDTAFHTISSGQQTQQLGCNVTRFKSPSYAASAIAKAKAGNGPVIWHAPQTVPVVWSGVPGTTGTHYLYNLGWYFSDGGPVRRDVYLAIQVVGPFIVSAASWDKGDTTQSVTAMVANLRAAKLVS